MERLDDLVKRVERLERELREERTKKQRDVEGTADRPVQTLYVRDPQTGSVGRLEYDSDANAARWTKER